MPRMPPHFGSLHLLEATGPGAPPEDLGAVALVLHVDDTADRSILWTASGWTAERPVRLAQIVCVCGWRSPILPLPPDARYVASSRSGALAFTVILSGDGYLACTHEWAEHADDDGVNALRHQHARLPRDLPPAFVALARAASPEPVDASTARPHDDAAADWPPIVGPQDPKLAAAMVELGLHEHPAWSQWAAEWTLPGKRE